jgi:hypothetical protein
MIRGINAKGTCTKCQKLEQLEADGKMDHEVYDKWALRDISDTQCNDFIAYSYFRDRMNNEKDDTRKQKIQGYLTQFESLIVDKASAENKTLRGKYYLDPQGKKVYPFYLTFKNRFMQGLTVPQATPDGQDLSERTLMPLSEIQFDVAFSFPGEQRDVVQQIVDKLKKAKRHAIFYDKDFTEDLAVIDMDLRLTNVYKKQSKLVCVFICKKYEEKRWCGLEWRAIREIIDERKGDNIMLMRMDDTEIPRISINDGYIDMREYTTDEIIGFIERRIAKQKGTIVLK